MTFPLLALAFLVVSAVTVGGALVTRRYFFFGMLGSTFLLALHGRVFLNSMADDAFISFRYAQNLADGHGPVWNVGEEPVEGYTGILWLLPLAVASKAGLSIAETARYLGFACSVGTMAVLYPLTAELPAGRRLPLAPVLAGLGLAAAGPFALWTFAGMEMPLFIFLIVAGVWLHLREEGRAFAIPWSGPVFALAMAARPEGAIFAAVTGAFKLHSLGDSATRRRRLVQLAVWAGSLFVLYGGYFLWRFLYYGYLFPNTFYAKVDTGLDYYERGLHYLAGEGSTFGLLVLAAGLVAYVVLERPAKAALYLGMLAGAWLIWVVFSGGDTLMFARFIVPALPFLYLGAALGAALLLSERAEAAKRLTVRGAAAVLFAAALLAALYPSLRPVVALDHRAQSDRVLIGRWMAEKLPPGTTIALTAAGAIAYYSELPTLDMLGLTDAHIAHAETPRFRQGVAQVTGGIAGHEKYDIDYVLARRPQVIYLEGSLRPSPLESQEDYAGVIWIFPNQYYLLQDPRTFERYEPVAVALTDTGWLNLLVDKDATEILEKLGGRKRGTEAAAGRRAELRPRK